MKSQFDGITPPRPLAALACTAVVLLTFAAGPASAACTGKLDALAKYAGGDAQSFLRDPAVSSRMTALAGPALGHLKANLDVSGSVALIDCDLVVEGNAMHQGGDEDAVLDLNLNSGAMTVGIQSKRRIVVLAMPSSPGATVSYNYLPVHVKDWTYIAAASFRSRTDPPYGLNVLPPQGR